MGRDFQLQDRGEVDLKGFDEPVRAWGWLGTDARSGNNPGMTAPEVRFAKTDDGVMIGYASLGAGPVLLEMPPSMQGGLSGLEVPALSGVLRAAGPIGNRCDI